MTRLGTQNGTGTISNPNFRGLLAMQMLTDLSAEELRATLRYEPDTGLFYWLRGGRWNRLAGKIAGTIRVDGYVRINIGGQGYWAHRLAWLYMTGEWPKDQIDHKNCNPNDNRWSNLRAATGRQNRGNKGVQSNSLTGVKGVHYYKSRDQWVAYVGTRGALKRLGYFNTLEEAKAARSKAAKQYFGDFSRDE